ncbi:alpha/beta fold hydrolase [Actinosynnema sp. NPDC004786]
MDEHKVISGDGRVVWAAELGRGEPLVLCHGEPGPWDVFDGLAELLANRVRVIRWGRSERGEPYTTAHALADLDAVLVHFGLARTALLGHSRGAEVALRYALDHPDRVSSLVYVSGAGLGHDGRPRAGAAGPGDGPAADGVVREGATRRWGADLAGPVTARRRSEEPAAPRFGVTEEADAGSRGPWEAELVARCRDLAVPTLIVDGAADPRPRRAVDPLADALPDVARVVLPGAGHVPWVGSPGSFGWAVLAHLAR